MSYLTLYSENKLLFVIAAKAIILHFSLYPMYLYTDVDNVGLFTAVARFHFHSTIHLLTIDDVKMAME